MSDPNAVPAPDAGQPVQDPTTPQADNYSTPAENAPAPVDGLPVAPDVVTTEKALGTPESQAKAAATYADDQRVLREEGIVQREADPEVGGEGFGYGG
jgi:hypothetical protein